MKKIKLPIALLVFSFLLISFCACEKTIKGNDNKNINGTPIEKKENDDKNPDTLEEQITESDDILTEDEEVDEIIDFKITEVDAIVTVEEPKGNYRVILETDSIITLDQIGTLNVWIGSEDAEYKGLNGTVNDTGTIPERLG